MKYDFHTINSILKGEWYNFNGTEKFTFLNIAKPSGDLLKQIDTSHELYFTVYETDFSKEGWYDVNFDRRKYIDTVLYHRKDISVITDKEILNRYKTSRKIMYVPSLPHAINKLYIHTLNKIKPKIAAITGSVGKTTAVALLEDILNTDKNTLRLYSKRITPLNLYSMIVNFLEEKHDIIALEMSMNRKDHIKKLATILPPDYAAILNITNAHIGSQDIHNQNDIWIAKKAIFNNIKHPIINIDYPIIQEKQHELKNTLTFGLSKEKHPDLLGEIKDNKLQISYRGKPLLNCSPYILTELSVYQILVSTAIALQTGINPEKIKKGINNFVPKEHRLITYSNNEHKIIFDGDITLSSRLKELANNYYSPTTLIISNLYTHNGNDTPQNIKLQKQELAETFSKFDNVLVADNIQDILLDPQKQKFKTFHPSELKQIIKEQNNTYFIHHSVYFRDNIPEQKNGCYYELKSIFSNLEGVSLLHKKYNTKER